LTVLGDIDWRTYSRNLRVETLARFVSPALRTASVTAFWMIDYCVPLFERQKVVCFRSNVKPLSTETSLDAFKMAICFSERRAIVLTVVNWWAFPYR
jgi:hypothetical protein